MFPKPCPSLPFFDFFIPVYSREIFFSKKQQLFQKSKHLGMEGCLQNQEYYHVNMEQNETGQRLSDLPEQKKEERLSANQTALLIKDLLYQQKAVFKYHLLLSVKTSKASKSHSTQKTSPTSGQSTPDIIKPSIPDSAPAIPSYHQALDYSEIKERLLNPDQGFYRTLSVTTSLEEFPDRKNVINDNWQLYHLRIGIGAFSAAMNQEDDYEITEPVLQGLDDLLSYIRERGKNVVIRFFYDNNLGKADMEPALPMILRHIEQLSHVLDQYPDVITAIEAGLIGPNAEMYASTIANDPKVNNAILDAWLTHVDETPILVRTPSRIYQYLGITRNDLETTRIPDNSPACRLGLFNDGMFGSGTDLGTFAERAREFSWFSLQNSHLPYGGEVTIPESSMHDLKNCIPEMFQIHLNYLNYEWNYQITQQKWMETYYTEEIGTDCLYYGDTGFTYIENHLGYRFVLEDSTFSYENPFQELSVSLRLKNVGFGNLNKRKLLTFLFVPQTEEEKDRTIIKKEMGLWEGELSLQKKICFSKEELDSSTTYTVYLKIDNGEDRYPIRFANPLWNEELKANEIGIIPAKESVEN